MPIEDVAYLLRNSVPNSSPFFIDSSLRNRQFYPTPSEYVVQFDEPLRHVFGFDILDASVASTLYNIDTHNYTFTCIVLDMALSSAVNTIPNLNVSDDATRPVLEKGLYELGFSPDLLAYMKDRTHHAGVVVVDAAAALVRPPVATPSPPPEPQFALDVPTNYYVMVRHVISSVLMKQITAASGGSTTTTTTMNGANGNGIASVLAPAAVRAAAQAAAGKTAMGLSYLNALYAIPASAADSGIDMTPQQEQSQQDAIAWLATQSGQPTDQNSYLITQSQQQTAQHVGAGLHYYDIVYFTSTRVDLAEHQAFHGAAIWNFTVSQVAIETGNYTVTSLLTELNSRLVPTSIFTALSTSTSEVTKQGKLRLSHTQTTRIIIWPPACPAAAVLGYDLRADATDTSTVPVGLRPYNIVPFGAGPPAYMSVLRYLNATLVGNYLDAPGLINMLGSPYITLRCPEIESHMNQIGKYDNTYSTGVGVFKMSGTNIVSQVRFDYVNLIRKPFHPIARFPRMTLRFENSDGTLYNFKGINHQLLITIKYYTEQPRNSLHSQFAGDAGASGAEGTLLHGGGINQGGGGGGYIPSVLNPDYDPDFVRWMISRWRDSDARTARPWEVGYSDDPVIGQMRPHGLGNGGNGYSQGWGTVAGRGVRDASSSSSEAGSSSTGSFSTSDESDGNHSYSESDSDSESSGSADAAPDLSYSRA